MLLRNARIGTALVDVEIDDSTLRTALGQALAEPLPR